MLMASCVTPLMKSSLYPHLINIRLHSVVKMAKFGLRKLESGYCMVKCGCSNWDVEKKKVLANEAN